MSQTNSGNNNNKFYRIQLLVSSSGKDYRTWTRWGRVGEHGQHAALGSGSLEDATKTFEKKFKDKSGYAWANKLDPPKKGKYAFIEKNYEDDSSDSANQSRGASSRRGSGLIVGSQNGSLVPEPAEPESKLRKPVQDLIALIFNNEFFAATMHEMEYDVNKLPLGKLSKHTLRTGFERLKELAELLADPSLASSNYNDPRHDAIEELSNSFYSIIPHAFGRNRPPIISNNRMLKKEITLLESLSDMEIANDIMKNAGNDAEKDINFLDRQFAGLGLQEMTPCK